MTINSTTRAISFVGNGSTLIFAFTFKVFETTDIVVILVTSAGVSTTLTLNTHYTVTLNLDQDTAPGGNVTMVTAPSNTETLAVTSDVAYLQPTDLTNQGGFFPSVITDSLDRATIQIQQVADSATRSLKNPITDDIALDMTLPAKAARLGKYLAFDANGEPTASVGTGNDDDLRTDLAANGGWSLIDSTGVTWTGPATLEGLTMGKGANAVATSSAYGVSALAANLAGGTNNTAIGYQTLIGNTTGTSNTAVGSGALDSNTTGAQNVGVGVGALNANSTGANNVALGVSALNAHTAGNTVAVGTNALVANTGGTFNTAVGFGALIANTTGSANTVLGNVALGGATTSTDNVAIGYQSMRAVANTATSCVAVGNQTLQINTAAGITAVGRNALTANTSGTLNTAVGFESLKANASGANNTAVGHSALVVNTASNNTAVGTEALKVNVSGTNCTAVGCQSLVASTANSNTAFGALTFPLVTSGNANTAIGLSAGGVLTTGTNNTCIGNGANTALANTDNSVNLGNSSIATLRCAVALTVTSDARDKANIVSLTTGLDFINSVRPVTFDWNCRDGAKVGQPSVGFLAQELLAAQTLHSVTIPTLVNQENPDHLEVTHAALLPVLVKAIQELSAQHNAYVASHP